MIAVDADDGGGQDAAGIAGVEDQREAITQLLYDLRGAGAGWKAGKIRAGTGHGAADCFDERGRNFGIRPTQGDASGVAGDFEGQAMGGFDDKREAAGPEFIGEGEKTIGNIANKTDGLFDGVHQNRESFGFRAAFGAKDGFDGREIEGIDREAVKRVGGDADDFAAFDETGGVLHQMIFR